ncbi:MAG: type II toxin-antitoxin system prevent-host-death family antitoxin [Planctomycetes bacterium]|nr:type II toxin-antitoxin system prevent-host-death family antitoxin [Planctomycetota bacterium]
MKTIDLGELKKNLKRYITIVKHGKRVVISERGVPIAVLGPVDGHRSEELSRNKKLAMMVAKGLLIMNKKKMPKFTMPKIVNRGKMLSDIVIEDRR